MADQKPSQKPFDPPGQAREPPRSRVIASKNRSRPTLSKGRPYHERRETEGRVLIVPCL